MDFRGRTEGMEVCTKNKQTKPYERGKKTGVPCGGVENEEVERGLKGRGEENGK